MTVDIGQREWEFVVRYEVGELETVYVEAASQVEAEDRLEEDLAMMGEYEVVAVREATADDLS